MAVAMEWVARITAVALEMFLPGLAGQWLDNRLGTNFLVFIGFAVGLSGGLWHLLVMTRSTSKTTTGKKKNHTSGNSEDNEPL